MFRSATAGYVVLGSDIGGYLDRDDKDLTGPTIPLDATVFSRWTALGGLTPFMQLHGRANITPWTFPDMPDAITATYRYWAKLHHELVPFYYSLAEDSYPTGPSIMRPIGDQASWAGDYRFQLGDAFLVAPILDATGKRDVVLPAGVRWYDWWAPSADALMGGQTLTGYDSTDLSRIPLFVRSGAIIPAEVGDDVTGLGDAASAGHLTLLVYPDTTASAFVLRDTDDAITNIAAQAQGSAGFSISISRAVRDTLVRVRADAAPTSVKVDSAAAPSLTDRASFDAGTNGWFYDAATRSVWIHVPMGMSTHTIVAG
jgi:alpha-D-xyloside xylohydrolase